MPNLMDYAPRNTFQDSLAAILQGGLQGYNQGQNNALELRKEMWKEKLKSEMQTNNPLNQARTNYYNAAAYDKLNNPLDNVDNSNIDNTTGQPADNQPVDNTPATKYIIPKGYEIGRDRKGQKILVKTKSPTATDSLNQDLQDAKTKISNGMDMGVVLKSLQDKYLTKDFSPMGTYANTLSQYAPAKPTPLKSPFLFNPVTAANFYINKGKSLLKGNSTQPTQPTNYPTATNPNTGEKMGLINGQWQPISK